MKSPISMQIFEENLTIPIVMNVVRNLLKLNCAQADKIGLSKRFKALRQTTIIIIKVII